MLEFDYSELTFLGIMAGACGWFLREFFLQMGKAMKNSSKRNN